MLLPAVVLILLIILLVTIVSHFWITLLGYFKNFKKIKLNNIKKFTKLQEKFEGGTDQEGASRIYNFTDTVLPNDVQRILNLDFNYGLLQVNVGQPLIRIIKDLEGSISKVKDNTLLEEGLSEFRNVPRARCVNVVTNHINYQRRRKSNQSADLKVLKDIKFTKSFLKHHEDLVVMRSDKDNSTVVMYKEEYNREMKKYGK
ncbi:hypothetical protein KQX54_002128 [Cotesia glomerata]|uniref:Uncharacterized protein n=1 Tax=Cotesia glomerata TaxID=32391 RepID=A0AAV7HXG1_COTGL|nr:hypothetical protein KQX54_002128 [Cotesia glomerata]